MHAPKIPQDLHGRKAWQILSKDVPALHLGVEWRQ